MKLISSQKQQAIRKRKKFDRLNLMSENYEIHENKSKINSAIVKLLSSTSQIIV